MFEGQRLPTWTVISGNYFSHESCFSFIRNSSRGQSNEREHLDNNVKKKVASRRNRTSGRRIPHPTLSSNEATRHTAVPTLRRVVTLPYPCQTRKYPQYLRFSRQPLDLDLDPTLTLNLSLNLRLYRPLPPAHAPP